VSSTAAHFRRATSPGVLAVKVNSKIQCDRPVRDLFLTVRVYEDDKQRAKTTTDNKHKAFLLNEQTYVACETDEPTPDHQRPQRRTSR
jgi:hypothetical protein